MNSRPLYRKELCRWVTCEVTPEWPGWRMHRSKGEPKPLGFPGREDDLRSLQLLGTQESCHRDKLYRTQVCGGSHWGEINSGVFSSDPKELSL